MEIVTCPSCIIEIKVLSLAHSAVCGAVHLSVLEGSNVPKAFWCNHIGTKGNEDSFEYRSDSRTINLSLTYTKNLTGKLFVLEYTAFRKHKFDLIIYYLLMSFTKVNTVSFYFNFF